MGKAKRSSNRSRAARREGSPSLNIDKSLKNIERANEGPRLQDDILAARHGASVSKKKKQKSLSRQQRLRREKGMARASAVVEQLETKVKSSKERLKKIKNRSADWEDLNAGLRKPRSLGTKSHLDVKNSAEQMDVVAEKDIDNGKVKLTARSPGISEPKSPEEVDELDGIT